MTKHASDCAMNNSPALPPGDCDCGLVPVPAVEPNEPASRTVALLARNERLAAALKTFVDIYELNDCDDRDDDDAIEVPISALRDAIAALDI